MSDTIKQIVFDVGDVLMDFPTHAVTAAFAASDADAALLHREIFETPEWIATNRDMSDADALRVMLTRLPQRLHGAAEQVMARWHEWLTPNEDVNALAGELKGLGYGLYILSNTSGRYFAFCERIPARPLASGEVLSMEEKLMKPDPALFQILFQRFGLVPGECFFVDDSPLNIDAARWCGMPGCMYRGDIGEVRSALRAHGVAVAP